jgi:hypothetical protein
MLILFVSACMPHPSPSHHTPIVIRSASHAHQAEFKSLEALSFGCQHFPEWKRGDALCERIRQMAISRTRLRDTCAASFLLSIGRDHRVLVLEDPGACDGAGPPQALPGSKAAGLLVSI